jgi:hypothetical protein
MTDLATQAAEFASAMASAWAMGGYFDNVNWSPRAIVLANRVVSSVPDGQSYRDRWAEAHARLMSGEVKPVIDLGKRRAAGGVERGAELMGCALSRRHRSGIRLGAYRRVAEASDAMKVFRDSFNNRGRVWHIDNGRKYRFDQAVGLCGVGLAFAAQFDEASPTKKICAKCQRAHGHKAALRTQPVIAAEVFASYMKGWVAGAKFSALDPAFTDHPKQLCDEYHDGYAAGRTARNEAARATAERTGHEPQIMRLAEAIR